MPCPRLPARSRSLGNLLSGRAADAIVTCETWPAAAVAERRGAERRVA
jgi:hypothetical protein